MSTLNATLRLLIDGSFTNAGDLETGKVPIVLSIAQAFANGTGSNQGNEWFSDQRTLVATSETIDLTSGLTNRFGETVEFVVIRAFILHNLSTTSSAVLLLKGNAVLNSGWITGGTHHSIPPDGIYAVTNPVDGFTITNTTQDQLTIDSGAATITYNLWILGTT